MSQVSRPTTDVTVSGWQPHPVANQINEPTPSDVNYVYSQEGPEGDSFVVNLKPLAWPDSGPQTLTVRMKRTDADAVPVLVLLLQGTTPVAARSFAPSQGYADHVLTLTDAEKARITDYGQLRLRVIAGHSVQVACCPDKLPEFLTATVTQKTGDCTCLPDNYLLHNPGGDQWSPVDPPNGCDEFGCLYLDCSALTSQWSFSTNSCVASWTLVSETCAPFQLVLDCVGAGPFCDGSFRVTITE